MTQSKRVVLVFELVTETDQLRGKYSRTSHEESEQLEVLYRVARYLFLGAKQVRDEMRLGGEATEVQKDDDEKRDNSLLRAFETCFDAFTVHCHDMLDRFNISLTERRLRETACLARLLEPAGLPDPEFPDSWAVWRVCTEASKLPGGSAW